jgi:hypothetical protein
MFFLCRENKAAPALPPLMQTWFMVPPLTGLAATPEQGWAAAWLRRRRVVEETRLRDDRELQYQTLPFSLIQYFLEKQMLLILVKVQPQSQYYTPCLVLASRSNKTLLSLCTILAFFPFCYSGGKPSNAVLPSLRQQLDFSRNT